MAAILVVVGNSGTLNADDTAVQGRLATTLGHTVTIADDGAPVADTSPYALVMLLPSAAVASTRGDYDGQAKPVLSVSGINLPDLGIQVNNFASGGNSQQTVYFEPHAINGSLSGVVTVYDATPTANYQWYDVVNLAPGATILARSAAAGARILSAYLDVGDAKVGGALATHRIIYLPYNRPGEINAAAWQVFDNGVAWALGGASVPNTGTGTGTATWTGTATGSRASAGVGVGDFAWTGAAVGARPSAGTGSGSATWTGAASGTRPSTGTGAGTATWTGTATGTRTPKATGVGTYTYTGTASGSAPVPGGASGTGSGTFTYAGTATGSRASLGTGTGDYAWTGMASGASPGTGNTRDITVTATLDPRRWTATLPARRRDAALTARRWTGDLP